VFDKFIAYAETQGIKTWNGVSRQLLERYAAWLDENGYAYRTEYLELCVLKQAVRWLATEGLLPADRVILLPLKKPVGTETYCWSAEEVQDMRKHCAADESLKWLEYVIVALACTGLRISELASLRLNDIDSGANQIVLTNESYSARKPKRGRRETKSGRSRSFPIHPELQAVIQQLSSGSDGLMFRGPTGNKLDPDDVRRLLIRDVLEPLKSKFPSADDEVGFKDGRLHSFRHYFCSVCANSGVPEHLLMTWLGHRESAMVRHYYHANNVQAQQEMARLGFV
jgi:integrase